MTKARWYHIVVAKRKDTGKWEMLFGDYYKQVALDEKSDLEEGNTADDYEFFKVVTVHQDTQVAIDARMAELNKED